MFEKGGLYRGEALVADPRVDMISLTGGIETGSRILEVDAFYRGLRLYALAREERAAPPEISPAESPEEAVQLTLLQERLQRAVYEDLPKRCRMVFILSRFEGLSNKEIAARLGVSVRTVENQMNHALKVLRKKLGGFLGGQEGPLG